MSAATVVHWFRHDLRLGDHPSWTQAAADARAQGAQLLAVFILDPAMHEPTAWSPQRVGPHRRAWLMLHLQALDTQLRAQGQRLHVVQGDATEVLPRLLRQVQACSLHAEAWPAPQEQAQQAALSTTCDASAADGLPVRLHWHAPSVLLPDAALPWPVDRMPDGFTPMRQAVEAEQARHGDPWQRPQPAPSDLPAPPQGHWPGELPPSWPVGSPGELPAPHPQSAFPYQSGAMQAGEAGALAHLQRYLARGLPHRYKATRNQLLGVDFSSKWSPWLALGAISSPQLMQALRAFEAEHGTSEGSHWLWFELLWREHFRLLQHKHGAALYRWRGLCSPDTARQRLPGRWLGPDSEAAQAWRQGRTGQPLVDAGLRELAATGYLSNRMRQIVASWLVHDLQVDWRVGAAWFEHHLLDFDVHSNQGNWLYLAGLGTDPRGGRRFDPIKQAREHDPDGRYQRLWAAD